MFQRREKLFGGAYCGPVGKVGVCKRGLAKYLAFKVVLRSYVWFRTSNIKAF